MGHFYKWLGTGGTVSRRTANKKLTKLYILTITKALTKTTNCTFRATKWRGATHDQKIFSSVPPLLLRTGAPTFNSLRRHCTLPINGREYFRAVALFWSQFCIHVLHNAFSDVLLNKTHFDVCLRNGL